MFKDYEYTAVDGKHWPDGYLGESLLRNIDLSEYLTIEEQLILTIEWTGPEDVKTGVSFIEDNKAYIQLRPSTRKSYTVSAHITYTGLQDTEEVLVVPMVLKVY